MPVAVRHLSSPSAASTAVTAAATAIAVFFFFRRRNRSSTCISSCFKFLSIASSSYPSIPSPLEGIAAMDDHCGGSLLVLCGKSQQEEQFARCILVKKDALKILGEGEAQGEIKVFLQSDIGSVGSPTFRMERYLDALKTDQFGRLLIWSPLLPSTHDVVSKNFGEFPIGTVCITDVQCKGRGRARNVWESPLGCLLFSFTLQMEDGRKVPLLQYVVSLAVTEAIKESCQAKGLPDIHVRIKWPNDLYLNGLKVGGVLCTSTYSSKNFNVCAGVGLNLDNEEPTTCLNVVLQELTSVSHQLGREEIIAAFFNNFEKLFRDFLSNGFQVLEELYYKTWLHSEQKVVIEEQQEGQVENVPVTIKGLTSSGYLLAVDEENRRYELHPNGNSFDFFKGLVRRKLD
ncbi:hypothetical protein HPP92_002000 [Vanilla planifolia]|uniref:BPL/LPL catalytic domain-containing protein n=1 Tax=Vanilla planifolia TaxID=51239 RepID=A0A835S3J9_VANPL|nr:hypothetical protein HPP92_002257 [Vanilla planifolia]KAG0501928.1 hypothetical protein HPP92_002000 [Vanilla planifolia]